VTADVFLSLVTREVAGGLVAVARQRWVRLSELPVYPHSFWVALDAVQYPGNLGTVLRTANAVGSQGVILLDNTTEPYDPASVRASLGAVFSQQLVQTSFLEFVVWKRKQGCRLIGTSPGAAADYRQVSYEQPFVLLMGCEREGLRAEQQAFCDEVVRIPMMPNCDSLNLAVSTSVVLYEAYQQRQAKQQE
jgi:TrmH family RNA methyltransferase